MIKRFLPRMLALATLPLLATGARADSVEFNRTVFGLGEPINAAIVVDQYRRDDVYVGVRDLRGAFFFLDSHGTLTPYLSGLPTPAVLSSPQPGRYNILNLTVAPGMSGSFIVYMARGKAGIDVLAEAAKSGSLRVSGDLDMSTLETTEVHVDVPASVSGDHDGDGHPDDDTDHDGFHDDDHDQNGFHDDDADEDGHHDDDRDEDGFHDDDLNHDGHHDADESGVDDNHSGDGDNNDGEGNDDPSDDGSPDDESGDNDDH